MKHIKITLELDLKFPEASRTLSNGDVIHFNVEEIKTLDTDYLRESILWDIMNHRENPTIDALAKEPVYKMDTWSILPNNYTYIENGEECDPDWDETLIDYHMKLTTKVEEVK